MGDSSILLEHDLCFSYPSCLIVGTEEYWRLSSSLASWLYGLLCVRSFLSILEFYLKISFKAESLHTMGPSEIPSRNPRCDGMIFPVGVCRLSVRGDGVSILVLAFCSKVSRTYCKFRRSSRSAVQAVPEL